MEIKLREAPVKCVIFDLDGTLVDTIDDLGLACAHLLCQKGITPEWTKEDYKNFVGNGARLLVKRAFGGNLTDVELDRQYELFKKLYGEIMLDNAYVYSGMADVVNLIKKSGIKLAICTNKPDAAADKIAEHFFGKDTFAVVRGAIDGAPKKPDPTIANEVINTLGVEASDCIWVGDSAVDIETAENLGCECIAVTWGFRSRESLLERDPDYIIDSPKDILKILNI